MSSRRVKVEKPEVGSRVSVPRYYFDDAKSTETWSSYLHASVTKLYGTVVFLYDTKARIKWDIDGYCNDLPFQDICIEACTAPKQVADEIVLLPSCSSKVSLFNLIKLFPVQYIKTIIKHKKHTKRR